MLGRLEVYSASGKVLLDTNSQCARLIGVYQTPVMQSSGRHEGSFVVDNVTGTLFAQGIINRSGGIPDARYGVPGVEVYTSGNRVYWAITISGAIAWFSVYATIFYGVR